MRLLIFPALPSTNDGYGIAVGEDIKRLQVNDSDEVIWYVNKNVKEDGKCYYIKRFSKMSFRRLINTILLRTSTEIIPNDIKKLPINLKEVDEVFCGDVMFYRALRTLFPSKKIVVRFHNCYARIHDRVALFNLKRNLSFVYRVNLKAFYKLEKDIFNDKNVHKIFISEEDRNYYVSNSGHSSDSEVWGFTPQINEKDRIQVPSCSRKKIVWYGGLDSHKIDSIKWFISEIYSKLYAQYPWIEFHLYGRWTESFNDRNKGIYGHGFYKGEDMPYKDESLYINPDLTGGGVKIKLLTYFENNVVFLTTPYGYEGYPPKYIDDEYCYVRQSDSWLLFLTNYFAAGQ